MTLAEAEKKFGLPMDTLKRYVSCGFLRAKQGAARSDAYREEDFTRLGLIETLLHAGFTVEETRTYLALTEQAETDAAQIRMLRKRRGALLEEIHQKQQLLDHIDFMIWDKKKEETK